ncbi:SGNH/GDSL hydrolase family protein [Metamycoplasma equirhinis]|uniref:SGNH/GDSL hydrolase family protein n=1 Tax=Metamycoplasma equirhinis TaxID=92402 RepID=UPI003594554B
MNKTSETLNQYYKLLTHEDKILRTPINYVAIGDFFAAGFNSKLGFNTNGKLLNGEITGLDYPSFFALAMRDNNIPINSFINLSMPSGNIDFISALIKNDKKSLKSQEAKIDMVQSIDWQSNNIYKNFFSQIFNNWNISKNDFQAFSHRLKDANLITITLGFVDLFFEIPFSKILKLNKLEKEQKMSQIDLIANSLDIVATKIIDKYVDLINELKKLNKQAQIVITNYAKPLMAIESIFESFIWKDNANKFNVFNYLNNLLNYIIKKVANISNVNFVDVYDEAFWGKNSSWLNENIFSVFCTEKGYKKVAYDLFAKLSLNKNKINELFINTEFKDKYIENENYWTNDLFSHHRLFNIGDNLTIFKNIYEKNKNYKLLINTKLENNLSQNLSSYLNISDFLILLERFENYNFYKIARKILNERFIDAPQNYQSVELLKTFLDNNENSKETFLTLLRNGKVDKILFILQNKLKSISQSNPITYAILCKELTNIIRQNQSYVYGIFKLFFDSEIVTKNKNEIKLIIIQFINDIINSDLLNFLFKIKNNDRSQKIKSYLYSLNSFSEIVDFVIDAIINYSDIYRKLKDFDELWTIFITQNKFKLIYLLFKLFNELTEKNKFEQTIEFIYQTILSSFRSQKLEPNDERELKASIVKILNITKSNSDFTKGCITSFLNNIKNISFYDLLYSKTKTYKLSLRMFFSFNSHFIISSKIVTSLLKIKRIIKKNKI